MHTPPTRELHAHKHGKQEYSIRYYVFQSFIWFFIRFSEDKKNNSKMYVLL